MRDRKKILIVLFVAIVGFYLVRVVAEIVSFDEIFRRAHSARLNQLMPRDYNIVVSNIKNNAPIPRKNISNHLRYYTTLLAYYPERENSDIFYLMGFFYAKAGLLDEAKASFQKCLQLAPGYFYPAYNLGLIQFQEGNFQSVIDVLEPALQIAPQVSINFLLSSVQMNGPFLKEFSSTQKHIQTTLSKARAQSNLLLIKSYYHQQEFAAALNLALICNARKEPFEFFYYFYAGLSAYQLGQYSEAVNFLNKCVQLNPNHKDVYTYLALCMEKMGQSKFAFAFRQKASKESVQTFSPDEDFDFILF